MLDDLKKDIKEVNKRIVELGKYLDIFSKSKRIKEFEERMGLSDFWQNQKEANEVAAELKSLQKTCRLWEELKGEANEFEELAGLIETSDEKALNELEEGLKDLKKRVEKLEFARLLGEKEDRNNAILSINAGAGGTEACDWTAMLLRMYSMWASSKGYSVETIDFLSGEQAGIKNVTVIIKGEYAYGYLKVERGVHRLVRISPFDSSKRRHTSFASVDVIPEVEGDIAIEIKDADVRVDVFRAGGPGGQGVNTTDSAVRITHLSTGLVVQCQNERSQIKNRATAMKVLKARLYELERKKKEEEMAKSYSAKQRIEWGSQIRSYVMHPYSLVNDHRTGVQISNVEAVMNGAIDEFMEGHLKWMAREIKE